MEIIINLQLIPIPAGSRILDIVGTIFKIMPTIQIKIGSKGSTTKKVKYHNPLKQAVITTLSFFDIFSRPLRLQEIEEYL
ncbi:MAG: hypothetical protein CEN92_221, partial [Candidatus Berkelbacteria bacterium Licking1014_96]